MVLRRKLAGKDENHDIANGCAALQIKSHGRERNRSLSAGVNGDLKAPKSGGALFSGMIIASQNQYQAAA